MSFQSCKNPNFENFRTPNLRVPGQNDIWLLAPWPSLENITRGKVVVSPNSNCDESCESVFARASFMHQKCSNYALINLLFGLCMSVWLIYPLVTHPSPHLGAPTHPSTLKVLWTKECTPTPYPSVVFTFGLTFEFIKEFGGVSLSTIQ
jgi:hypothetical protein